MQDNIAVKKSDKHLTNTSADPQKTRHFMFLILGYLILILLAIIASLLYRNQKFKTKISQQSSATALPNLEPSGFCGDADYCSINQKCAGLPDSAGFCKTKEICDKIYLCGRGKELLNDFASEILFKEDSEEENGKTRIGYVYIRNTESKSKEVDITSFECLNYEGLCKDFNVLYPNNFQVKPRDVVIFPLYIERHSPLTGLVSLEFTAQIGDSTIMFSVDVIFNGDKTCFYQWGNLDMSRKVYFDEPSTVDWTSHCQ